MIRLVILFFWGTALMACADEPRYYRAECIVRVNIDWSTTDNNRRWVVQQIFNVYPMAPKMGFNEIPPSAAIQGDRDQFLYFQYKYDCENRVSNTVRLLEYVRENVQGLPEIEVDKGVFQPDINTIRASGGWWVDSDSSLLDE